MRRLLLFFLTSAFWGNLAFGQLDVGTEAKKMGGDALGWKRAGSFGLDLSGMGILQPRVGAGGNRIGAGGLITYTANKKAAKSYWDNSFTLQLATQRLGKVAKGNAAPGGFQKNLDVLRLNSRYGRALKSDKLFFAVDGLAQSLLLKTYQSNYLTKQDIGDKVIAQFLAPVSLAVSPGIDYRPNAKYSFFVSPASFRLIYVGDDDIAALNIHGNDFGKNNSFQVGAAAVAKYTNKYFKDRINFTSELNLFTNYLKNPQNIDINFWRNSMGIQIVKGLSLDLLGELNYDHDAFVMKDVGGDGIYQVGDIMPITTEGDIPKTTGPDRLGRGPQLVGAFLLKYSRIF